MPTIARFFVALSVGICWLWAGTSAVAQSSDSKVGITISPGGMHRHAPGRWTILTVNGINRSDQDVEELVTVQLGDDSNFQFARRFWIPAQSRRQTWVPALLPEFDPIVQPQLKMTSIRLKESDQGEQFQSNFVGEPMSERSLLVSSEQTRTAVMFEQADRTEAGMVSAGELLDATYQCRDSMNSSTQDLGIVRYTSRFLPTSPKTLDAIDHLIVASDRLVDDVQSAQQIRTWLHEGGRLWLMIDRLSPETAKYFLEDMHCFTEIDRVEMTQLRLDTEKQGLGGGVDSSSWSGDYPVKMVRVATRDVEVQSTVNGWPAAFWSEVGKGELLVTTVDLHGLMSESSPMLAFRPTISRFFIPRDRPQSQSVQLTKLMDQEIGYSVPSRGLIATVLGLHLLLVLLAGIWFATRKQLHFLSIVLPLAAGGATVFLLMLGQQNTTAVESTVATGQFVRVSSDGGSAQVDSTSAIYSQEGVDLEASASSGTTMRLADGEADGELKRVLWTDDGDSHWMHLQQPPGVVRHINSEATIALSKQMTVKGRFTEDGFQGRLNGLDASECEDVIVVSDSTPTLALKRQNRDGDLVFVGGADNVLLDDQYINENLMTDQQRQRQELLRGMIKPGAKLFGREPTMLLWAKPIEAGLTFGDQFKSRGSSLMSVPIKLTRSESGSDFLVPSSFVRMEAREGERGFTALFNSQTGRWLGDMTKASSATLDCFVPPNLLPCKLSSVTIEMKLTAPSRTLELKTLSDGEYTSVFKKEDPTGTFKLVVDDPALLSVQPQGAWRLMVSVSPTQSEQAAEELSVVMPGQAPVGSQQSALSRADDSDKSVWQIDFLHVSFTGAAQ